MKTSVRCNNPRRFQSTLIVHQRYQRSLQYLGNKFLEPVSALRFTVSSRHVSQSSRKSAPPTTLHNSQPPDFKIKRVLFVYDKLSKLESDVNTKRVKAQDPLLKLANSKSAVFMYRNVTLCTRFSTQW